MSGAEKGRIIKLKDITVDLWGPMACFTPPYAKVERYSYPVPTPSALRGILSSIYGKPQEFYWVIRRIEVMSPIQYMTVRRNEVHTFSLSGKNPKPVYIEDCRTQRATVLLKDVHYRVTASIIVVKEGDRGNVETALRKQALRRITTGQCFHQPYMGLKEYPCYFALADMDAAPIQESHDYNLMVYDTHVPWDAEKRTGCQTSLFNCVMVNGVIDVPDYRSPEVLKIQGGMNLA